jgi:hypothetical protein
MKSARGRDPRVLARLSDSRTYSASAIAPTPGKPMLAEPVVVLLVVQKQPAQTLV